VLHEIRSDEAQFLWSLFLLLVGPGPLAVEALLRGKERSGEVYLSAAEGNRAG